MKYIYLSDRQALFMDFTCSCCWIVRPLHQKQTDIEKNWVFQEVTVVSLTNFSGINLLFGKLNVLEEFPLKGLLLS